MSHPLRFKKATVIIPVHNESCVAAAVRSILDNSAPLPFDIVVAGNDGARAVPSDPRVRFLETDENALPSAKRNRAVEASDGDLILFADSDCVADPGWIKGAVEAMSEDRHVVAGGIRFPEDNLWDLGDNMAIFHAMHVSAKPRELSGGAGSNNLAISREAFLRAQGFNPDLWVGEDWDLIRRLRGAGYRIYFDPRFAVLHNSRRDTRSKVIEHARSYGRGYFLLMQQGLLPAPKTRMDFLGGHAPTAWLWSVFRATAQTAQLFLQHPAMLAYLRALPAVWLFYFVRRQEILREAAKTQGYSTGSCDK